MLRHRALLRYGRDEVHTLHRRAAEWFAARGSVGEAIRHALSANDVELAAGLVEDQSENLLNRWDRVTLERWLAMLPEGVVWHRPRLLVSRSWMLYRQWRMTALESVSNKGPKPCSVLTRIRLQAMSSSAIHGQILALRCAVDYVVHGDYGRAAVSGKKALQQLSVGAQGARALAAMFHAFSQQALGQHRTRPSVSSGRPMRILPPMARPRFRPILGSHWFTWLLETCHRCRIPQTCF